MYKVCNQSLEQARPQIATSQQWQISQQEDRETESMVDTTINNLQSFIKSQQNTGNGIILCINVNEIANYKNNRKLCDPIIMRHDTETEPNILSRGYVKIDFILCTRALLPFILRVDILSFGTIAFSDHRGLYIDINLHQYLRNLNTDLVTNTPRTLISSQPKRVLQYKTLLKIFLTNQQK